MRSRAGRWAFTATRWVESSYQIQGIRRIEAEVEAHESNLAQRRTDRRAILFFNASTRILGMSLNGAFSLLTSWGLRMAGDKVVYAACVGGMPQCMLGTLVDDPFRGPPCRSCSYFTRRVLPAEHRIEFGYPAQKYVGLARQAGSMTLDQLLDFEYEGLSLGQLCLPSLRWALRRHNLKDDRATRHLLSRYILGAANVHDTFLDLLAKVQPKAVVVFNGQSYPEAIVKLLAARYGIPAITHEVGARSFSAFFTHGEATAYPVEIPTEFKMGPAEEAKLDHYLNDRFQGDFTMAGIRFWPSMTPLPDELQAKIGSFRQMVVAFTNVIFDTSQPHANVLFEDMFHWLYNLLGVASKNPDTLFIIRAHPDEYRPGKEARESVESTLRALGISDASNVEFIRPSQWVSSYELIRKAKFVLVYNSTIGLEASILGAPVLSAGRSRYSSYPTVFMPETRAGYEHLLSDFLERDEIEVPPRFSKEARRFLYYQLFHTSLDFSRFLKQAPRFPGQVRMRKFQALNLHPDNCEEIAIIQEGIHEGRHFVYPLSRDVQ